MWFVRRAALGLLVGAAFLACAEQSLPTAGTRTGPKLNFLNNPDVGNGTIVRYTGGVAFVITDEDAGLAAVLASGNGELGCVVRTYRHPADVQKVLADGGEDGAMVHALFMNHDLWATVYSPIPSDIDCGQFASNKVAQGFANLLYTDNDYLATERISNNSNTFGFTAEGKLDLLAGGTAMFNARQRCVWDGEDLNTVRCDTKIGLH